jgi:hypothetical protein
MFSLVRVQFLFLSRGSPLCTALFLKLIFYINDKFLYLYLYYRMFRQFHMDNPLEQSQLLA